MSLLIGIKSKTGARPRRAPGFDRGSRNLEMMSDDSFLLSRNENNLDFINSYPLK